MSEPNPAAAAFYQGAEQANPQPTAPTDTETPAQRFYRLAEKQGSGQVSDSNAPKPNPAPTPAPPAAGAALPADPATAAAAADLRTLGVVVEGVSDSQLVAANDAALKAHRATQDAEVQAWEAESRKTIPAHEIAAATAFAATLDPEVRDVLASSGLGSHPAVIRLAAKLAARGGP